MTNYSALLTAIAAWLHRSDLTAVIPQFVLLAEEDMNKRLRVREMEAFFAGSTVNKVLPISADVAGIKSLWPSANPESPLKVQPFERVKASTSATPTLYAIQGNSIVLNADADVEGVIYERIPALSSTNATNNILTAYPSLYLFGAMRYAYAYLKDTNAEASYAAQFQQRLDEVNQSDMRDRFTGPLTARPA